MITIVSICQALCVIIIIIIIHSYLLDTYSMFKIISLVETSNIKDL